MNTYEKYLTDDIMTRSGLTVIDNDDEFLSDIVELFFDFVDSVDYDVLSEESRDLLDEILEVFEDEGYYYDYEEEVSEVTGKLKRVVRGGKIVKKRKCPKGYRVVGTKCVRMSAGEKRVRSKASKRGARKTKGKRSSISRKMKRSRKKLNR